MQFNQKLFNLVGELCVLCEQEKIEAPTLSGNLKVVRLRGLIYQEMIVNWFQNPTWEHSAQESLHLAENELLRILGNFTKY